MLLLVFALACDRPVPVWTDSAAGHGSSEEGSEGSSGEEEGEGSEGGEDTGSTGPFRSVVVPLYAEKCEDCHSYWGSSDDPDGLWSGLLEGEEHDLVEAGDPSESMFYTKMLDTDHADFPSGSRMPLVSSSVSSEKLATLAAWIEDGAEESGFDAYTEIHNEQRYHCFNCHRYFGVSTDSELYDYFMETEVDGHPMLVPGEPESSLVYLKLAGGEVPVGEPMPLNRPYVEDSLLAEIEAWIEAGAEND
jgi:hypothetical protein